MKAQNIKPLPLRQDILAKVDTGTIFKYYLGGKLPGKPISSPLRSGDSHPSFSVFFSEAQNQWLYKDHGTDEAGDVFVFVKRMFGLFKLTDAYCKIAADLGMDEFETKQFSTASERVYNTSVNPKQKRELPKTTIMVLRRKWKTHDAKFWNSFGITRPILERCEVYPISHFFVNKDGYETVYTADKHAYAYLEYKDDQLTYKVYQPFNRHGVKWKSNNNSSTWELWRQLPKEGDICIIASSRKDAMVIKSLWPEWKVTSVALQSEGVKPKGTVVAELRSRFKRVYCLFDADTKGERSASVLESEYGVKKLSLGYLSHSGKDIAEWRKKLGENKLKQNIISQIKLHPNACNDLKPF